MLVAFKTFRDCPEEQRPVGISLDEVWIEQKFQDHGLKCKNNDNCCAKRLQNEGYVVVTLDFYENYKIQVSSKLQIEKVIEDSIAFGVALIKEFSAENVLLGITQLNQTGVVLDKLDPVLTALQAGSLYEAIKRVKSIPVDQYDDIFITGPRLIKFLNQIEDYLGMPLSAEV